jgi:elongation factor Ts
MVIRRGKTYHLSANTAVNYYIHSDSKKAAVVELSFDGDLSAAKNDLMALAKELAMQSVAMSPKWLRREDAPSELVAKEREIYRAKMEKDEEDAKSLAAETGKPYKVKSPEGVEKMLEGRINKFFQESCLLEQVSIRESKMSIAQVVKSHSDKLKGSVQIKRFDCYIIGME